MLELNNEEQEMQKECEVDQSQFKLSPLLYLHVKQ